MTADYPDSHYHRALAPVAARAPLAGRVECETCVVGGGLAGLCTALPLAERGREVVVLEAGRVAWSASGRNGGFVSAGYAASLDRLVRRLGRDHARRLARISRDGVGLVRERVSRLGLAAAGLVEGMLVVARHPAAAEARAARDLAADLLGSSLQVWSPERVREVLRSPRYFDAVYDPEACHLQPLAWSLGLADAVEAAGGRVHERSAALELRRDAGAWVVATAGGRVRAREVVLAGSAHLGRLQPRLARAVLPVATYMMATEPLGERLAEAVRTPAAVADTRNAGDYYRARDGRILWGGRMTTRTAEPARLAALLRGDLVGVYPQLDGVRVETAWSGLMGYTRHRMPLVGRLQPGLWTCTAFGGHGLNTTAACGELVARGIAGLDDEYRLFEPFGAVWAGGPAGRVAAQATYWHYQLGDRWREWRARRGAGAAGP